jgi:hypothetical protein
MTEKPPHRRFGDTSPESPIHGHGGWTVGHQGAPGENIYWNCLIGQACEERARDILRHAYSRFRGQAGLAMRERLYAALARSLLSQQLG